MGSVKKGTVLRSPMQDREATPGRVRVGGTGKALITAYNPDMALAICEQVAAGRTLPAICAPGSGFVTRDTFHRWRMQYPELERAYHAARMTSAYNFEDESIEKVREIMLDPGSAQRVRAFDIAVNHLRWIAARRNPQMFSEKAAIKVTIPIQINTGLDLGGSILDQNVDKSGETVYHVEAVAHEEIQDVDEVPWLEGGKSMKRGIKRRHAIAANKAQEAKVLKREKGPSSVK